jgi:hypothetical protein
MLLDLGVLERVIYLANACYLRSFEGFIFFEVCLFLGFINQLVNIETVLAYSCLLSRGHSLLWEYIFWLFFVFF